jgi:hypothetical protein
VNFQYFEMCEFPWAMFVVWVLFKCLCIYNECKMYVFYLTILNVYIMYVCVFMIVYKNVVWVSLMCMSYWIVLLNVGFRWSKFDVEYLIFFVFVIVWVLLICSGIYNKCVWHWFVLYICMFIYLQFLRVYWSKFDVYSWLYTLKCVQFLLVYWWKFNVCSWLCI